MSGLWVRVTINLPGAPAGSVVEVDPDDPYMRAALKKNVLVPYEPATVEAADDA